jgi:hypothetical protein
MSEHKLNQGLHFINGLKVLGRILNYNVETEFPLDPAKVSPKAALDVAWFKEKNQRFPLFIFEVESQPTNSMAYNPVKVLSKESTVFEKPLFFFQIILKKGVSSERVEDLQRQFGTHNYRIYRLEVDQGFDFLRDILTQHRRLQSELNIPALMDYLIESKWLNINIEEIISHICQLGFEKESGNFYPSLGLLTVKYEVFSTLFCKHLIGEYGATIDYHNAFHYGTYFGSQWFLPIHLGINAQSTSEIHEKAYCLSKLKTWQENGSHLSMIGPHFGLSQDYDQFLIFGAGGLLALLASLFRDFHPARLYLSQELEKIIDATRDEYKIVNLMWLMHITPKNEEGDYFLKKAAAFFQAQKFFSAKIFFELPLITSEELIEEIAQSEDRLPDFGTSGGYIILDNFNKEIVLRNAVLTLTDVRAESHYAGKNVIDILRVGP